jgi:RNA polymerase sigma-70 factor (ECF subfamily)
MSASEFSDRSMTAGVVKTAIGQLAPESEGSGLEREITEMFDQYRPPLLRYLSSFGLGAADAEEVVQETFLALFLHLRQGKPRTNLQAWIFRVAHNQGLKRCQAIRRGPLARLDDSPWADPGPNPEQAAARRQRQARLLAVVRALSEQDRRCLILRAEGLRYREITEVLGMSLGAVAQSLERSLARLARADHGEVA